MSDSDLQDKCVNCGSGEMEIPLIRARYGGGQFWICSRCMPILIHKPEQLLGAIKDADKIPPASHEH